MKRVFLATAAAVAFVVPSNASASGVWHSNAFHSPTGNIRCKYFPVDEVMLCSTVTPHLAVALPGPAGQAVLAQKYLRKRGPTLHYDEGWQGGSFTCISHSFAMECFNKVHGFFINKRGVIPY